MGAFVTLPVGVFVSVNVFGKNIHFIIVEGVDVPGKVIDVECNILIKLEVRNFKHEPEGVASSVSVCFH